MNRKNKLLQRIFALLQVLAISMGLVFSSIPFSVYADEPVMYNAVITVTSEDSIPLDGVAVKLEKNNVETISTNIEVISGKVTLNNLAPANYTYVITKADYEDIVGKFTIKSSNVNIIEMAKIKTAGDIVAPKISVKTYENNENTDYFSVYENGWTNKDVIITIDNTNVDTDIKGYKYYVNDGVDIVKESVEWTSPILAEQKAIDLTTINIDTNSTYWIVATNIDGGIIGNPSRCDVKVDKTKPTAPIITATTEDKVDYVSGNWTNQNVGIKIDSSISLSGIEYYEYATTEAEAEEAPISKDMWVKIITNEDTLSNGINISEDTNKKYWFRAISNAGANGETQTIIIKRDTSLPSNFKIEYNGSGVMHEFPNVETFNKFFNKTVNVKIYAEDDLSGIKEIKYHIDGEENKTTVLNALGESGNRYFTEFNIQPQFRGKIVLDSVTDNMGNIAIYNGFENIVVDKEIPTITAKIVNKDGNNLGDYESNTWTDKDINITLSESDISSGIKNYEYKTTGTDTEVAPDNQVAWTSMESTNVLEIKENINIKYWFRAVSYSEVHGEANSLVVLKDSNQPTKPTMEVKTGDTLHTSVSYNGTDWTNKNVYVTLSGAAALSGIDHYEYAKSDVSAVVEPNEAVWNSIGVTNKLEITENTNELYWFRAVSKSGVPGEANSFVVKRDGNQPSPTTIKATDVDNNPYEGNVWINKDINIKLSDSTTFSGIKNYKYIITESDKTPQEGWWSDTTKYITSDYGNLSISGDTNKKYWFKSVSNSGLESEANNFTVLIQKTAPKNATVNLFKDLSLNEKDDKLEGDWYNYKPIIKITKPQATATPEPSSAPIKTYYKLWNTTNGDIEKNAVVVELDDSNQPSITTDGKYELKVWTEDEAGNKSEVVLKKLINVDLNNPNNFRIEYNTENIIYKFLNDISFNIFFKDTLTVRIYAQDDLSGVKSMEYHMENQNNVSNPIKLENIESVVNENTYYSEFSIEAQFKGKIELDSVVDKAGNTYSLQENELYKKIVVDNDKPTVPIIIATTEDKNKYSAGSPTNQNVYITVKDSTALSGIDKYEWCIKGEVNWQKINSVLENPEETDSTLQKMVGSVEITTNTNKEYLFRAISNAGIPSDSTSLVVLKDSNQPTKPTMEVKIGDTLDTSVAHDGKDWTNKNVYITLSGESALSGINHYEFKTTEIGTEVAPDNQVEWTPIESTNMLEIKENTNVKYWFRAVSNSGVFGEANSFVVKRDGNQPSPTTIKATDVDNNPYEGNIWINKDINIKLSDSTTFSGIKNYKYIITESDKTPQENWWSDSSKYKGSNDGNISISEDTNKKYWFKSVSNSGLESEANNFTVLIQKTIPNKATITLYKDSSLSTVVDNSEVLYNYNPVIKITKPQATSTPEPSSAPIKTYYKLWNTTNGEEEEGATVVELDDSNQPSITRDGKYELKVWTEDEAGNISEEIKQISVDSVAPTDITIEYSEEINVINKVLNSISFDLFYKPLISEQAQSVKVRIYAKDELSGVKNIEYYIEDKKYDISNIISKDGEYYGEVSILPEFKGKIKASAVTDVAGNTTQLSTEVSKNMIIENKVPSKPTITATTGATEATENKKEYKIGDWTNQNVYLTIEGSTALSGIDKYEYCIYDEIKLVETGWYPLESEIENPEQTDVTVQKKISKLPIETEDKINANRTYKVRAISKSGLEGEISSFTVQIQKTLPANASIKYETSYKGGWHNEMPTIEIINPIPKPKCAPITTYYKLWNTTNGEIEGNANVIKLNDDGSNQPEITKDGEYKLEIWTIDEADNVNDPTFDNVEDINVDTESPNNFSIEYIENDKSGGLHEFLNETNFTTFFKAIVTVRIYAEDNLSGVSSISYHINGVKDLEGKEVVNQVPILKGGSLIGDADKKHCYAEFDIEPQFKGEIVLDSVTDEADNKYTPGLDEKIFENIVVDKVNPTPLTIEANLTGDRPITSGNWTNETVFLTFSGSNALSGIDYEYTKTEGEATLSNAVWNKVKLAFIPIYSDTNARYWIRATGNSGLESEIASFKVQVQKTKPMNATIALYENNKEISKEWYNEENKITITKPAPTKDPNIDPKIEQPPSAPITTYYKLSHADSKDVVEEGNFNDLSKDILSIIEGQYRLEVWTKDEAGNSSEDILQKLINVDTQMPKNFGIEYNNPNKIHEFLNLVTFNTFFKDTVNARIYAADNLSGVKSFKYHIKGIEDLEDVVEVKQEGTLEGNAIQYDKEKNLYYAEFSIAPQFKGKIVLDSVTDNADNIYETSDSTENIIVDKKMPTAPIITATTVDGEEYKSDFWTNKDLNIQIAGSKALSGIETYQYCINNDSTEPGDNAPWIELKGTLKNADGTLVDPEKDDITIANRSASLETIIKDTNKTYWFRAVSNSGVNGLVSKIKVLIQKTIPENATVSYENPNDKGWNKTNTTITIKKPSPTATPEPSSAPITTYYKLSYVDSKDVVDEGNFKDLSKDILSIKEGQYRLEVWTKDEAGNSSEDVLQKLINVDTQMPNNFEIEYNNPNLIHKFLNKVTFNTFFKDTVEVRLYAKDNLSGVKSFKYHIEGIKNIENKKDVEEVKQEAILEGENVIKYDAKKASYYGEFNIEPQFKGKIVLDSVTDIADNVAGKTTEMKDYENIVVDKLAPTAPVIKATIADGSDYISNNWTNQNVNIKIDGSTALSGIETYQYYINDGSEPGKDVKWEELKGTLANPNADDITVQNRTANLKTISEDTNKTYWFRAKSNSGVEGKISKIKVLVQKTIPKNATVNYEKPNDKGWNKSIPTIKITNPIPTATPKPSSAPITTYYKLWNITNGETEEAIKEVVFNGLNQPVIKTDGEYKLKIWTKDEANNRSDVNLDILRDIKVDRENPTEFRIEYDSSGVIDEFLHTITFGTFFNKTVTVKIYAKDNLSGIKEIKYHREGQENKVNVLNVLGKSDDKFFTEFDIEPQFKGKIVLDSVTDIAENTAISTEFENLVVDQAKPTHPKITATTTNGLNYVSGNWTNQNVNLKIDGSTALSGIETYQYCINDGNEPSDNTQWIELKGTLLNPNADDITVQNRTADFGTISGDTNKTYWFRAVSNSGVNGEISKVKVLIQKTIPQNATVSYEDPNEEGWYKNNPTITITKPSPTVVPMPSSAPIKTYYRLWNTLKGEAEGNSNIIEFNGSNPPSISTDGEYRFRIWTQDEAGNRSDVNLDIVRDIKVDLNSPKVSVSYNNNNSLNDSYFKEGRVATITIDEKNFKSSKAIIKVTAKDNGAVIAEPSNGDWTNDGDIHTTSIPFTTDGDYTIDVTCNDKADNTSSELEQQKFTIDLTEPKVDISNITDLSANKEAVKPIISYSDTNLDLDKINIILEGNRSGIVQLDGGSGAAENGQVFTFNPIKEDDNYVLSAKIVDKAGNEISKKVSFSVNQNGSTFEFIQKTIINKYTNKNFIPQIRVSNVDEVNIISLTMNGKNEEYTFENDLITFADEINTDGKYIIGLDVKDAAQNVSSMEPIEFIFDNTSPKVFIEGVEEDGVYLEKVNVTIKPDNVNDNIKEIVLNDELLSENEYKLNDDKSINLSLEDYKNYKLEVLAVDEAGNTNNYEKMNFKITNNIFVKFYMNKPLFYGSIGLASIVSVGGIVFALFGRKVPVIK